MSGMHQPYQPYQPYHHFSLQAIQEPAPPPSMLATHVHCPCCGAATERLWQPFICSTYPCGRPVCRACGYQIGTTGVVLREVRP